MKKRAVAMMASIDVAIIQIMIRPEEMKKEILALPVHPWSLSDNQNPSFPLIESGTAPVIVSAKCSQRDTMKTPVTETIVIRRIDQRDFFTRILTNNTSGMMSRISPAHPNHWEKSVFVI
ncbi:MAG: hypothetical protein IIX64_06485 [Bacteroidales bacterium]|nr:hypothetical protein [Bacteroidales bacterium]